MKNKILRGDLYYANLNPVRGSEQGGIRPVLIIQNNLGNRYGNTVVIAPISTKQPKLPTHVKINQTDKIRQDSIILLEQIRVIDKTRLRQFLGRLDSKKMEKVNRSINIELNLRGAL